MPYSVDDYGDAIKGVDHPFEHKTLAAALLTHRVPIETVQHVNNWQFGQSMQTAGAYKYTDRSMRFQAPRPSALLNEYGGNPRQGRRLLVHEAHHASQDRVNPEQFQNALFDRQKRGKVEAYAENEADRRVPGSVSAYDRLVASGQNRRFSDQSYKATRVRPE
jgi:hypothetical protein